MDVNNSDISLIKSKLQAIFNKYQNKWNIIDSDEKIHNANYIPILNEFDSNIFQITIIPTSGKNKGKIISISNSDSKVSIQSVSKVFTLGLALKRKQKYGNDGRDYLKNFIGIEPSFFMYNSKDAIKMAPRDVGIPFTLNPFVNAGAIATTSLITKLNNKEPFTQIIEFMNDCGGMKNELEISRGVYNSEIKYIETNIELMYYLKKKSIMEIKPNFNFNNLNTKKRIYKKRKTLCKKPPKKSFKTPLKIRSGRHPLYFQDNNNTLCIEKSLSTYTAQCSILVNSEILAKMAYPLGNNGINLKGKRVLTPCQIQYIISTMVFCGMYNTSSSWFQTCGIPSKSGVGGGIIGVVPNKCVISVVSPPLNKYGNSYLGTLVFEEISNIFGLHILSNCKYSKKRKTVSSKYVAPKTPDLDIVSSDELLHNIEKCAYSIKNICNTTLKLNL